LQDARDLVDMAEAMGELYPSRKWVDEERDAENEAAWDAFAPG
jgi:hypothetical protein